MFGKFKDVAEFLDAYIQSSIQAQVEEAQKLPIENQAAYLQAQLTKDIVEVKATVLKRLPDDTKVPKHYQLDITLDDVMAFTPDVKKDIMECKAKALAVFLAIRFGDKDGIIQPIKKGLNNGDKLHLKGQWITKDQADSHGGEKTSVLHFTHHPVGFTCTSEKCYS